VPSALKILIPLTHKNIGAEKAYHFFQFLRDVRFEIFDD